MKVPGLRSRSSDTTTGTTSLRSSEQRARPAPVTREDGCHRAALPLREGVVVTHVTAARKRFNSWRTRAQDLECPVGVWPRRTGR
jgi:hypothetical protein